MSEFNPKLDVFIDGERIEGKVSLGKKAPDIVSKFILDQGGTPPTTYNPIVHTVKATNNNSVALTRLRIYFRPTESGDYFGAKSPNYEFKTVLSWFKISFNGTTWYTMGSVDPSYTINPDALLGTRERPVNVPASQDELDANGRLIPGKYFTFQMKVDISLTGNDIREDVEALSDIANALKAVDMCIRYGASTRWVEDELSGT